MLLDKIRRTLRKSGFVIYTRPYELNIVGLRSLSVVPNRFDDEIHVFYRMPDKKWVYHVYKATTDPGTFWLNNPSDPQGTAILVTGQYVDAYEIGLHRGKYKALVQRKPVTILRDYDRNAVLDFFNGVSASGLFGINIHRALATGSTLYIDKYSAGCQVFASADAFNAFMVLCEKHKKLYGNRFTYTLIDFRALQRDSKRRIAYGAGALSLFGLGYLLHRNKKLTGIFSGLGEITRSLLERTLRYE
jgi:hypothetical protein